MDYIVWVMIGYFSGSIPTGYWIGRLKGIDLRSVGSGSTGATNVLRAVGKGPALLTLIIDILKGFLPVFLAMKITGDNFIVVLVSITCIVGHSKSIFLSFKGGKSSATGLGVLIGISPLVAFISFSIWLVVVFVSKYSSLGSLIAVPLVPVWFYIFHKPPIYILFGIFIAVYIVLIRHRENIKRLIEGKEPKIGEKINSKK